MCEYLNHPMYWDRHVWENNVAPDQMLHYTVSPLGLHCLPLIQGPVVQSIISLTSLLAVKMLTVLVSTIHVSNSQVFLLEKCEWLLQSYSHFFSKNISVYALFNDQSFNDILTNNIISFEQLGPAVFRHVIR